MSLYIEPHPRLNMIDGVLASMAGEWPGIKSNKFPKTKKIIHLKNSSNIFFLDDSFSHHGKRRINIQTPKEELTIKPKKRRILSSLTKVKQKTIYDELFPIPLKNSNRLIVNREYDFEKRAKYYKMMQVNFNKKLKENKLINKNKSNSLGITINDNNPSKIFSKQFYDKVSSSKILGVTLTHDLYQKYKNKVETIKKFNNDFRNAKKRKVNSYKYLNSRKKVLEMMRKQEKLKHDIEYVASLK